MEEMGLFGTLIFFIYLLEIQALSGLRNLWNKEEYGGIHFCGIISDVKFLYERNMFQ